MSSTKKQFELPCLPGYRFNTAPFKTRFHLDNHFDFIGKGVPALKEKVKPNMLGALSDRFPSVYSKNGTDLPSWVTYDKQILTFDAIFFQDLPEMPRCIRKVKIYFYLEDGTVQVVEPKIENSGLEQGTLIGRHRIRFPGQMDANFYDFIDLNIGREVEFYGHKYKIINCDKFTRNFLNRQGVHVPDPIFLPGGELIAEETKEKTCGPKKEHALGKFLANDRKVLRFYGHWDDDGFVHNLEILFYLSNDTCEILESDPVNEGKTSTFLKRSKLPKNYREEGGAAVRFIKDTLTDTDLSEYYKDCDIKIGEFVNCYGRKILLTQCDGFTRSYYKNKYGYKDEQLPVKKIGKEESECRKHKKFHEEDLTISIERKKDQKDAVLRFQGKMVSKDPNNAHRNFLISYYVNENCVSIYEYGDRNSGFSTRQFFSKNRVSIPDDICSEGVYLSPQNMFVGALIIVNGFYFVLTNADEFTLKYMEENSPQFPKSNIKVVMDKIKEKLIPVYKKFVADEMPDEKPLIPYDRLRDKLCEVMGSDFTEQEMITIWRAFSKQSPEKSEEDKRRQIRDAALCQMKNSKWNDFERFKDYITGRDPHRSGKITPKDFYHSVKVVRMPYNADTVNKIVEVLKKDPRGMIFIDDIMAFFKGEDYRKEEEPKKCPKVEIENRFIDWFAFNKALSLEVHYK